MRSVLYTFALITLFICNVFFSVSSFGADMDTIKERMKKRLPAIVELKSKGIVGENNKGYLEFIGSKREKEEVVIAENEDRKKVYTVIAQKENVPVDYVGKRRAMQIAETAEKGEWLQSQDGKWYRK